MDKQLVDKINETPFKAFFAITGGGQSFIGDYTGISGASKTFIGGIVPYSSRVFESFIGGSIEKTATEYGARRLAEASYRECLKAGVSEDYSIGIGASSSVAKDGEREGRIHKLNIACHTYRVTETHCFELKQNHSREDENKMISNIILYLLAFYSGVGVSQEDYRVLQVEPKIKKYNNAKVYANIALAHNPCDLMFDNTREDEPLVIYPGSFNPIHQGHLDIYDKSAHIVKKEPYFEISVKNTDKGEINFVDLQDRLLQFGDKYNYVITNSSRFYDKVDLIRRITKRPIIFVVGQDTWTRIWDIKYVPDVTLSDMEFWFESKNVRFLVFGRNCEPVIQSHGETVRIKHEIAENYHNPVSSSEIRLKKN